MSDKSRRFRRGFTLVELLVVIGIIVLLISILLPSLGRAREQANRVKCASNLQQIRRAIVMYANENKGDYPRTFAKTGAFVTAKLANTGYQTDYAFGSGAGSATNVGDNNV